MFRSLDDLAYVLISVVLVMFSAMVHEVAHGAAALALGDPTAKEHGRLTLDPRAHIDSFGSVVLPLLMALMGGPIFAFAKPVPYNPRRLRNPRRDELLVALAGPASNLLQALVATGLVALFLASGLTQAVGYEVAYWVFQILTSYLYVNLVLCFFNLVPFPPLDGSKVVLFFLSGRARQKFYELSQYSMFFLLLVLYVVPSFLHLDPLGWYLDATAGNLYSLLLSLV